MIDESFFDENGEVKPERPDEFVAHIRAKVAKLAKSGGHILLTGPAGNALAAHRRNGHAHAVRVRDAGAGVCA